MTRSLTNGFKKTKGAFAPFICDFIKANYSVKQHIHTIMTSQNETYLKKKPGPPKGVSNNPAGRTPKYELPYKKRKKQISMMVPIDKWDECNAAMRAAVAKILNKK